MGNLLCKGLFGRKSKSTDDYGDDSTHEVDSKVGTGRSVPDGIIPLRPIGGGGGSPLAAACKSRGKSATFLVHGQVTPQSSDASTGTNASSSTCSGTTDDGDRQQRRRQRRRSSLPPPSGLLLTACPEGEEQKQHAALGARLSAAAARRSSVGADTELLREQINDRLGTYSNTIVALTVLIQHLTSTSKNSLIATRGKLHALEKELATKTASIRELEAILRAQEEAKPVLDHKTIQTDIEEGSNLPLPPVNPNATRDELLEENSSLRHVIKVQRSEVRGLRAERADLLSKREQLERLEVVAQKRQAKIEELEASMAVKDSNIKALNARILEHQDHQMALEADLDRANINKDLLQWRVLLQEGAGANEPKQKVRRSSSATDLSNIGFALDSRAAYITRSKRLARELSSSHGDSLADHDDPPSSPAAPAPAGAPKTVGDVRRSHGGLSYRIVDPQPLTPGGLKRRLLLEESGKRSLHNLTSPTTNNNNSNKTSQGGKRNPLHKSESCVSSSGRPTKYVVDGAVVHMRPKNNSNTTTNSKGGGTKIPTYASNRKSMGAVPNSRVGNKASHQHATHVRNHEQATRKSELFSRQ